MITRREYERLHDKEFAEARAQRALPSFMDELESRLDRSRLEKEISECNDKVELAKKEAKAFHKIVYSTALVPAGLLAFSVYMGESGYQITSQISSMAAALSLIPSSLMVALNYVHHKEVSDLKDQQMGEIHYRNLLLARVLEDSKYLIGEK